MKYYDLDVNGWPLVSYARPQPGKVLHHLTDQPSEHHRAELDGDGNPVSDDPWVEDSVIALRQSRVLAVERVNAGCNAALADVRNRYPVSELQTWPSQHREAAAYDAARQAAETPPATPMLDGIAAARGITTAEQVDRVLAAVDRYTTAAAAAVGKRQRLEADIEAAYQAGDREALEAVAW